MSNEAITRRELINKYRVMFLSGQLEYAQAEQLAQPLIDELNVASKAIADKYNRKFKKWTAVDLLKGKGFSI